MTTQGIFMENPNVGEKIFRKIKNFAKNGISNSVSVRIYNWGNPSAIYPVAAGGQQNTSLRFCSSLEGQLGAARGAGRCRHKHSLS